MLIGGILLVAESRIPTFEIASPHVQGLNQYSDHRLWGIVGSSSGSRMAWYHGNLVMGPSDSITWCVAI